MTTLDIPDGFRFSNLRSTDIVFLEGGMGLNDIAQDLYNFLVNRGESPIILDDLYNKKIF